jgi:CheY-like chemotaxis protein
MRILLADDDADVRESLTRLLTSEGHEVIACKDGRDAMHEYRKAQGANEVFDCVVTDYQMPWKNGVVLIMEIRALEPQQPIVLVSGDPPKLGEQTKLLTGEFEMLAKPYRSEKLLEAIKKSCDQTAISDI